MKSPCSRINASTQYLMLTIPLPHLYRNGVSVTSIGYKAKCTVITLIVLWPVCLSSFLVNFKNGPEYITRENSLLFIPLMSFFTTELSFVKFRRSSGVHFKCFFFHQSLLVGVRFHIFKLLVIFLFCKYSHPFLIRQFFSSCYL